MTPSTEQAPTTLSPLLSDLAMAVSKNRTIEGSSTALIRGIVGRMQDAFFAAITNGATKNELAPVQREIDMLSTSAPELAALLTENTPADQRTTA